MAQELGEINGTWEGVLAYVKGAGLRDPDWKPDFWRLVIREKAVQVFFKRGDEGEAIIEAKPGKYRIERHMTNALLYSIDSGTDSDGVWVETEAFLLTQKSPDVLGATLAVAINNPAQPLDTETSKFFSVSTGELHLVKTAQT